MYVLFSIQQGPIKISNLIWNKIRKRYSSQYTEAAKRSPRNGGIVTLEVSSFLHNATFLISLCHSTKNVCRGATISSISVKKMYTRFEGNVRIRLKGEALRGGGRSGRISPRVLFPLFQYEITRHSSETNSNTNTFFDVKDIVLNCIGIRRP